MCDGMGDVEGRNKMKERKKKIPGKEERGRNGKRERRRMGE